MGSNGVTNPLCESRMENIDTRLKAIRESTDRIEFRLCELGEVCKQIPMDTRRIDLLERWRENFSFAKILLVISGTTVSITAIYEFIKRIITKQF